MRSCAFAFLADRERVGNMRVVRGVCHKCIDDTWIGEYTSVDFHGNVTIRQTKCRECYL